VTRWACTLVLVGLGLGGVAAADDAPAAEDAPAGAEPKLLPTSGAATPAASDAPVSFSHQGQIQVSLRLALGMRAIIPYEKGEYCGTTEAGSTNGNAAVCTGRAPFSFDLEVGYGVAKKIDALVELRLGLETDFTAAAGQSGGPRIFHLAPGARFFFSDAKTSKVFTQVQLLFDFTGYSGLGGGSRGSDFGVRNLNGLWFDLDRAYGFYAYVGETATFSRWLRFELEVGIGASARFR